MKRFIIYFFSVAVTVFLSGCIKDDVMPWEDRYTLSGRVSTETPYRARGTYNTDQFGEESPVGVNILYKSHETNKIYILLYPLAERYTAIFGDVSTLETTSFLIKGELGDVTFDDNCELRIERSDKSEYSASASVKGWIKTDLPKSVQTKSGPWYYDYTCEITLEWDEPVSGSSEHHKLYIGQITRK